VIGAHRRWPRHHLRVVGAPLHLLDPSRVVGPTTAEGLLLVVPPAEQGAARARGAAFDPATGRWYVAPGRPVEVHRFKRWLDPEGADIEEGPCVSAVPLVLTQRCYSCATATAAIVGVVVTEPAPTLDPDGFVPFDDVAEELADDIDEDFLLMGGVGRLRWRTTRRNPQGCVTNGCRSCDTVLSSWYLREQLAEHLAYGGTYAELMADFGVQMPVALLESLMA
jgi:hypothetical protein